MALHHPKIYPPFVRLPLILVSVANLDILGRASPRPSSTLQIGES